MEHKLASKSRRVQVHGRAKQRWLRVIGGGFGMLLGLELATAYFVFYEPTPGGAAGLCQIRDSGSMSCSQFVDKSSRTDLIRDSFGRH